MKTRLSNKYSSAIFRSPTRRTTRQRSGFKVSGDTTGGECKLKMAEGINVNSTNLALTFEKSPIQLVSSFLKDLAFVAFGGYVFPCTSTLIETTLKYTGNDGSTETSRTSKSASPNKWAKFGVHCIFDMKKLKEPAGRLEAKLNLKASEKLGRIDFFGIDLDSVYYYNDKDLWNSFIQKTKAYLPEIYYFDLDEAFVVKPKEYQDMPFSSGRCVVLKSCNRCTRYLLVDIENERNPISFSNHCVSRAPCSHSLFSTYRIVENECKKLPEYILRKRTGSEASQLTLSGDANAASKIQTYYGYQLECRSCKKYYVNAPLNPLRDSTQHREDSLRRRALEILVDKLLDREYIYHSFRLKQRKEFDVYIWERFGKKCFSCDRNLQSPTRMALDHTMPLSMLWPLDTTATCLCQTCNSQKRDKFPVDFYPESKLAKLSKVTGLSKELLHSKAVNIKAILELKKRVVWFFDEFLMEPDYQKIRRGKKASDLICNAVQAAIKAGGVELDLINEYVRETQRPPQSVSITG